MVTNIAQHVSFICVQRCSSHNHCRSLSAPLRRGTSAYYIILYHIISYYIILYHIISYYIMLYHVISCYIMLYHIISYYIILYHIISYYIILYHIISYYIILYHIISYYIILYHVISYYITHIVQAILCRTQFLCRFILFTFPTRCITYQTQYCIMYALGEP